ATRTVARRQELLLELDAVRELGGRADVHGGGGVAVGMPELDRQLRVGGGPAVAVRRAAPEDEGPLVEREARRVVEEHLAQPILRRNDLARHRDVEAAGDVPHDLAESVETFRLGEALRLQDELVLAVLDGIERMAVGVGATGDLALARDR